VQKRFLVVAASAIAFTMTISAPSRAQSSDPWIGTWKVNLDKSTFSPGPKPKVGATVTIEPMAGGIQTTIDGVNPEGQKMHTVSAGAFDGKDNPVKGAPSPNQTTALKKVDARTFEVQGKTDGKPTVLTRVSVSPDGKTLTAMQSGTTPEGQAVKNTIVAEKQ
jgi:hypothetical protein